MWWFLIPFLLGISGHTSPEEADRITDEYLSDEENAVLRELKKGDMLEASSIIFDGKYLVYLSLVFGFWSGLNSNG